MLIALSGLPGTGKTTIARLLARRLPALHIRVDTIEQALLRAGYPSPIGPEGYAVSYAVASDNLELGHSVVADCVNASPKSREAWEEIARTCRVSLLHVHLFCSDAAEHRRRLSERRADIPGHDLPDWEQVAATEFAVVTPSAFAIDTSVHSASQVTELIISRVSR